MGDDFNESADGGGTYTNDTNSTLQVALQPATPHLSLRRIAQAQLGRCMLLELPAELRNMIWKAVFSFSAVPHLRELHKFKKSDYDLVLRPLLEILLTCKQIYEEAKDMIWMLNTFRITTGPRERGDIYTAQSHPLWSKFRNIHFEGILELPWIAFPSACKVADTLTIAFLAARILSEPHLRIRSLIIHFQMYDVLHTLERHINLFAQIKVQEEVYFRISLKPDYFSISGIPPLAFSSRVNFAATEAFDMMIGSNDVLNCVTSTRTNKAFWYNVYRCDAAFAKINRNFAGEWELYELRHYATRNELGYKENEDEDEDSGLSGGEGVEDAEDEEDEEERRVLEKFPWRA